ncbi:hypothetical protein QBC34DRAFT_395809 [Podospora aff. communis PSN243]|uniref:Secreted protein n=1 Tax=Podospora aff. communis PSN243 TaxID=3040156 RepID=A0AAV9H1Z0_9PEZI|nr:hypothetical protein QBC34DRAFT_395809 [Podospora aff. communis PSN243]
MLDILACSFPHPRFMLIVLFWNHVCSVGRPQYGVQHNQRLLHLLRIPSLSGTISPTPAQLDPAASTSLMRQAQTGNRRER